MCLCRYRGELLSFGENVSLGLHTQGINVRHLGLLRSLLSADNIVSSCVISPFDTEGSFQHGREILLMEMVHRTLKNMLRHRMRSRHREQVSEPSHFAMRSYIAEFFNDIIGSPTRSSESEAFWCNQVHPGMLR